MTTASATATATHQPVELHPLFDVWAVLRRKGLTYREIGERYGYSHERVRQVIGRAVPAPDPLPVRNARRVAAHLADQGLTSRDDLKAELSLSDAQLAAAIATGLVPKHLILSPRRHREPDYELADILDALRVAWSAVQTRTPGATGMAWTTYDAVRRDGDPSAALLVSRFGWQNICDHAGVPAGPALRPKHTYIRRWSTNDLLFWVALYVEDSRSRGTRPTYNGYDTWQRAHADAPSGATLRNRMREIGVAAWNEILAAARATWS